MTDDYDINRRSIQNLFSDNNTFEIPEYQRDYAWDKDKAERMWIDLEQVSATDITHSGTSNLLGAMVVLSEPGGRGINKVDVVDGQQRLATLSLIFCSIRTYLCKFGAVQDGAIRATLDNLIKKLDLLVFVGSNEQPRVTLGLQDRDLFKRLTQSRNHDYDSFCKQMYMQFRNGKKRILDSHELLISNYKLLCKNTSKYWSDDQSTITGDDQAKAIDALNKIADYVDNIAKRNHFAYVRVYDRSAAYKIFSTFNSTGERLSQADLIKSHLLGVIHDDGDHDSSKTKQEIVKKWEKIFDERLEDKDTFLYESLLSRHPSGIVPMDSSPIKISMNRLYEIISKKCKSAKDVSNYVEEIAVDARNIKLMDYPDDLPDEEKYKKITHDFYGLQMISARYIRIPLLAAYRTWDLSDGTQFAHFRELVNCLLIFFFKFKFITNGTAEDIRRIAADTAQAIIEKKPFNEIISTILVERERTEKPERRVNEELFDNEFSRKMFKLTTKMAKYVISSFEAYYRRGRESEYIELPFELEHILPRSHEKHWNEEEFFAGYDDERRMDKFLNRLGNLTIISGKWNAKMGQGKFSEKRQKYEKSDFEINKLLARYTEWTAKNVLERERELCDLAGKVWSLDPYEKYLKDLKAGE